ncbi:hypothetical protein GCM10027093_09450 [Paraburkholderia jirisanensis]
MFRVLVWMLLFATIGSAISGADAYFNWQLAVLLNPIGWLGDWCAAGAVVAVALRQRYLLRRVRDLERQLHIAVGN